MIKVILRHFVMCFLNGAEKNPLYIAYKTWLPSCLKENKNIAAEVYKLGEL